MNMLRIRHLITKYKIDSHFFIKNVFHSVIEINVFNCFHTTPKMRTKTSDSLKIKLNRNKLNTEQKTKREINETSTKNI